MLEFILGTGLKARVINLILLAVIIASAVSIWG